MSDIIKKQAEELLEYLKEFSDTNWYCCMNDLLSALTESERKYNQLFEFKEENAYLLDKLSSCEQREREAIIKLVNKLIPKPAWNSNGICEHDRLVNAIHSRGEKGETP